MHARPFLDMNIWFYALMPNVDDPKHVLAGEFALGLTRPLINFISMCRPDHWGRATPTSRPSPPRSWGCLRR